MIAVVPVRKARVHGVGAVCGDQHASCDQAGEGFQPARADLLGDTLEHRTQEGSCGARARGAAHFLVVVADEEGARRALGCQLRLQTAPA